MEPPLGFTNGIDAGYVCRLKKALYGLNKSPRAWFDQFSRAMKEMGYWQSKGITLHSSSIQRNVL